MAKKTPQIDENMLRQVEELAGYGLTLEQIAAVLGFSERTMHRKKDSDDALMAAIRRGKAKASAIVGKSLFGRAKDGDVPAIRWWEMTRDGRSERTQTEAKVEVINDGQTEARLARLVAQIASEIEARDNTEAVAELEPGRSSDPSV
jgi:hypothetical protein